MKIIIKNKSDKRKGRKGVFAYADNGPFKTGYLIYDENDINIGIIFKADDPRRKSYGKAEILFDEHFEREYNRTWHVIKVNKYYLEFNDLERIMNEKKCYELVIDLNLKRK